MDAKQAFRESANRFSRVDLVPARGKMLQPGNRRGALDFGGPPDVLLTVGLQERFNVFARAFGEEKWNDRGAVPKLHRLSSLSLSSSVSALTPLGRRARGSLKKSGPTLTPRLIRPRRSRSATLASSPPPETPRIGSMRATARPCSVMTKVSPSLT